MATYSRVTVVGSRRRIDVSLPDAIPLAELLPEVVRMLDEGPNGAPAQWAVVRIGGLALDLERGLAEQGATSGTMLFLQDVTAPLPPAATDDFAQQVATLVDAERGRWEWATFRSLVVWFSGACFFAAGVALMVGGRGVSAVGGIVGVAIASLVGLALARLDRRRDFAAVITLATLSLWAAAGAGLAQLASAGAPGILAAALAAILAGALVAFLICGERVSAIAGGVTAATLLPAIVLGGCELFGARVAAGAAVLCPLGLAAIALAAPLAVRLSGLLDAGSLATDHEVHSARRLVVALLTGFAAMLVVSTAVLAGSGGWFAWGLIGATAVAVAAQSRHYRFAAEVGPLIAAAIAAVLWLELAGVARGGLAVAVAALFADGVLLAGLAIALLNSKMPREISRRLRAVEWAAIAVSVPLVLGVLGVYDTAARFARGFS